MRTCPSCSSDVGRGPACPTCGAKLPGPGFSPWPILRFTGGLGVLVVILAIAVPGFLNSGRASNDRNAMATLRTLATAEADFRSNDRDGNHVNDFWTGDVAGLYCISPDSAQPGPRDAIKLIELSTAGADSDPLNAPATPYGVSIREFTRSGPKARYWFWALRQDASETPPAWYRQETEGKPSAGRYYNTSRFGFLSYPDTPSAGKSAFIINEGYTMFRRPCDGSIRPGPGMPPGPVTHRAFTDWPSEATQKSEWRKLD
jgi:type II secretory pathway pseudopilin PulG